MLRYQKSQSSKQDDSYKKFINYILHFLFSEKTTQILWPESNVLVEK